ncbi:hypothetical protein BT93_A1817 [Corymbia citriodora subsp. variegata]|nr:hypothetical protein BT93_A1817 [Corymbia citriodora subsp. variegata]KAF8043608.1 hypothetical protein BT93_A1817 [Corymbia citriodora subsp. variegata]
MACRRVDAAKGIAERWKEDADDRKTLHVEVMELDLLSLSSVKQFAAKWDQRGKPLHILINNAGILLLGEPRQFSEDGLEKHIQVNHIATSLLTLLLLPSMLRANSARIVNVNSVGHLWGAVEPKSWKIGAEEERKFSSMTSYGSSKLAQLMFLKALCTKLISMAETSVLCVAVHPGIVKSNLLSDGRMRGFWMLDPSEGARNVLFCSVRADVQHNTTENFAYYSQCKPGRMSSLAEDPKECLRAWDETLCILGFSPNGYLSEIIASRSFS